MQTIAIRLRVMHLSAEMAAMRKWLDEHRCEPANFTFRRSGDIISIYAVFGKDSDGEAFKARFSGRRNDRNRIPSPRIWTAGSPKIFATMLIDKFARSAFFKHLIPAKLSCVKTPHLPLSDLFRRSRAGGNPGISLACPGPRFRGGDEFRSLCNLITASCAPGTIGRLCTL